MGYELYRIKFLFLLLLFCFDKAKSQSVSGSCVLNKVLYYPQRYIFSYQCYEPVAHNPTFPNGGSSPTEFTELMLSPNVYTYVPTDSICQFSNITVLDLSSNLITNITGLFQTLKCLTKLTKISLANNSIQTGLISTDFDDTFSAQLQSIDLSFNQISSIHTGVFIKSDGTNRFKNLQYLSFRNNMIKQFDLLWPLTIPYSSLIVDMSNNFINTLVNQLNMSYGSSVFNYPVTGSRNVIVENNQLQTFSDSNLLQYGLQSAYDLSLFLNKISNYDFRITNSSNSSDIFCACPYTGLLTVTWYKQLLATQSINTGVVINQIYCINIPNIHPLNISCLVSPNLIIYLYLAINQTFSSIHQQQLEVQYKPHLQAQLQKLLQLVLSLLQLKLQPQRLFQVLKQQF